MEVGRRARENYVRTFFPSFQPNFPYFYLLIFVFLVPLKSTLKDLTKTISLPERKSGKESKGKEERSLHL